MPSVLPSTPTASKSYAPLADEVNPSYRNASPAPTVTRNGTVVFSKRLSPLGSGSTSPSERDDINSQMYSVNGSSSSRMRRSDSEETLSPNPDGKRKDNGRIIVDDGNDETGDIGQRVASKNKGKGKERAWNPDEIEDLNEPDQDGTYPPANKLEKDEQRVQANLAKFAAADAARRKAARLSRSLPPSPGPGAEPGSAASSTSSLSRAPTLARRPLSVISESLGSVKRSSILGFGSKSGSKEKHAWDGELPLASPNGVVYANPYDTQPAFSPAPRMIVSPEASPFADPVSSDRRLSNGSARSASSPIDSVGFSYGYAGPGWRGGASSAPPAQDQNRRQDQRAVEPVREKWWHALCAWGSELDGGHGDMQSNQAGRTNPFE